MKLIILDRDGVINYESTAYIKSPAEWIPIPGSLEAIVRLNQAGYRVAIATNQSGVARKFYDLETLALIHAKMLGALAQLGGKIEAIFYCPHHPDEACACRKPQPGLLYRIAQILNHPLENSWMIGDSWHDVQAAESVKCKPILVKTGRGEETLVNFPQFKENVIIKSDLASAVDFILSNE